MLFCLESKLGRNYAETTNATYEVYFKETGEFKVVGKIVDGGYNDTITDGIVQRTWNARNAESREQIYISDVQKQETGTSNAEISNFNKNGTCIGDRSVRNGSSNTDNVKYSIAGKITMNNALLDDSSNIEGNTYKLRDILEQKRVYIIILIMEEILMKLIKKLFWTIQNRIIHWWVGENP